MLGQPFGLSLVALPVIIVMLTVMSLGLGLLFAPLMVFYRDTGGFLPYVTKIWLYVTPVLYFVREIPEAARVPALESAVPVVRRLEQIFNGKFPPARTCSPRRRGRSASSSSGPWCSWRGSVTLPSGSDRPPAVWVDDLWVSFRVTREKNQT